MTTVRIETAIVPLDGTAVSLPALAFAAELQRSPGAAVLAVHVDEPAMFVDPIVAGLSVGPLAQPRLDEIVASIDRWLKPGLGMPYEFRSVAGPAAPAIARIAESSEHSVIVLAAPEKGALFRMLFGSVAEAILRRTTRPVLAVPACDDTAVRISTILCPVNGTNEAAHALQYASLLAASWNARLVLVIVDPSPPRHAIEAWLETIDDLPPDRELIALTGDPLDCFFAAAENIGADLLVIGTHHEIFRDPTIVGTPSGKIIRHIDRAVLIVPFEMAN